jgi:hypothetical protein
VMSMMTQIATELLDGRQARRVNPEDVMWPALKFSARFSIRSPGCSPRYRLGQQYSWNMVFTARFFILTAG